MNDNNQNNDLPARPGIPSPIRPPRLSGKRLSLVPISPDLLQPLYAMALEDDMGFRWRFRGSIPTFDAYRQTLFSSVFLQFAIVLASDPRRLVGSISAYNANMQDETAYVAVMTDRRIGAGGLEALAIFLRYIFQLWPFRKLYFESAEYNIPQFAAATDAGLLKEEGRLKDHHFFDNAYWDHVIFALYRDDAYEVSSRFAAVLDAEEPRPPTRH